MMRHSYLAAVGVISALAIVHPSSAATIDFELLNSGVPTGSGQFSFSNALLGSTISASQVSTFTVTLDLLVTETYNSLGDAANPPPLAPAYASPFPYFEFDSASDQFLTTTYSPGQLLIMAGGSPGLFGSFDAFYIFDNAPGVIDASIYIEHVDGETSSFDYGFFNQIVATPVATPEPATAALLAAGLIGLAATGMRRGLAIGPEAVTAAL